MVFTLPIVDSLNDAIKAAKLLETDLVVIPEKQVKLFIACISVVQRLGEEKVHKLSGVHEIREYVRQCEDLQNEARVLTDELIDAI